jgi:hypothetical protein
VRFCNILCIFALVVAVVISHFAALSRLASWSLLFSMVGTTLLAGSITFTIPAIGRGIWGRIRWAILDFPKFSSTASFSPLRFYSGLLFLFVASALSAIKVRH